MKNWLWAKLAKVLARPVVTNWLITRAKRTPYFHLEGYMERYWLFNPYPRSTPDGKKGYWRWFPSIRLHKILREDLDRNPHDHPWDFRSIVLRGWYCHRIQKAPSQWAQRMMFPGDSYAMQFGDYHSIDAVDSEGVWTLFITWKYQGTWGFLVDGRKIPWRTYLGLEKTEPEN